MQLLLEELLQAVPEESLAGQVEPTLAVGVAVALVVVLPRLLLWRAGFAVLVSGWHS